MMNQAVKQIAHPEISLISVLDSRQETAEYAAQRILQAVQDNPEIVISYATGDTMVPVYAALVKAKQQDNVDFSRTHAFHLDEYYPTSPTEPHSFVQYLRKHVLSPLEIPPKNTHTLNGEAVNSAVEADSYDALLSRYGVDLSILGVGPGGHIGFNETGTPFATRTHLAALSPETLHRDTVIRGQNSPPTALTQGIATILDAKKIILIAFGTTKGSILDEVLYDRISEKRPASALRLVGDKVEMIIDVEAASQLRSDGKEDVTIRQRE